MVIDTASPFPLFTMDLFLHVQDRPTSPSLPGRDLTDAERRQVEALKNRDAEVRRHEEAHFNAGRPHTAPPRFEYQTGPDGRRYAVGGHVEIDSNEVQGDPEATLEKAQRIKRAALAPTDPSSQDRQVAARADRLATQARQELTERNADRIQNPEAAAPESASDPPAPAGDAPPAGTAANTTAPEDATPAGSDDAGGATTPAGRVTESPSQTPLSRSERAETRPGPADEPSREASAETSPEPAPETNLRTLARHFLASPDLAGGAETTLERLRRRATMYTSVFDPTLIPASETPPGETTPDEAASQNPYRTRAAAPHGAFAALA